MPNYINSPSLLYVHHSQVPQSVVQSNPSEWYHPTSEETEKLYASKKFPTFTTDPSWTDQDYVQNLKNYENQVEALRTQYNKDLMGAKDLKYSPAPIGYGPHDPEPLTANPSPWPVPTRRVIDAGGNYVDASTYNKKKVDRVKYDNSQDTSGDGFSYKDSDDWETYGFRNNTVSDLNDWTYDPHKAARHPDYATRQGNIASWDRVEGIPTLRDVTPVRDGGQYFTSERTIPDYSAPLQGFTYAKDNDTTRLPNSQGTVTMADLEASGLLSKPQTIQYKSTTYGKNDDGEWGYAERQSQEENARTARLQDLFTDRLLVPGKVDRSVQVSELLSDAIGDARRAAIIDTAANNNLHHLSLGRNLLDAAATHTFGRAHLAGTDNLSLPITFIDDVLKEGKGMNFTGDSMYTYLDKPFPLQSVNPRYKMYRDDGIIRVFTGADGSSWTPGVSKIDIADYDQQPHDADLLDRMRTSSGSDKFDVGTVIGADYHHNDFPANGFQGDIRNALLHEGIHAATGFNTNVVEEPELRRKRKLYRDMRDAHDDNNPNSPNDMNIRKVRFKAMDDWMKLSADPANKTTTLGSVLGVSRSDPNQTSRGYAGNSEAEMLRALHHAKSGFARHLIAQNKLSPEAVVQEVQDPDKFLNFMQGIYRGSFKGNNDDPTSYSFPSTMTQVGTEREMARSIAGIQPLIQTLLETRRHERAKLLNNSASAQEEVDQIPSPKDNHIFKNEEGDPDSLQWKERIYTPQKQLQIFRNNIWPQVHNNTGSDRYRTMA